MKFHAKLKMKPVQEILKKRNLETKGKVQKYIDSEVIRLMDPYTPFLTGHLKGASLRVQTQIGSGIIVQATPYAKRQYYTHKGNGLRGSRWFERMKSAKREQILRGAMKIAKEGN